jgi:VWFA-related protein
MRWASQVLIVLALAVTCAAQSIIYLRLDRSIIQERLIPSPDKPAERVATLKTLFKKAGCRREQLSEQPVPGEETPNVICTVAGTGDGTVVVAASSDYRDRNERGLVEWSSLVMLPLLAESLDAVRHRQTLVFAAFAGKDHGMHGAAEYLKQLTDRERNSIRAMVELQTIGRTPPMYVASEKDQRLADWLIMSARGVKLPYDPGNLGGRTVLVSGKFIERIDLPSAGNQANSKVFAKSHIPTIAITSLSAMPVPGLKSTGNVPVTRPTPTLDMSSYEDTYHLLCIYLLVLDRQLGKDQGQPPASPATAVASAGNAPAESKPPQAPVTQASTAPPSSTNPRIESHSGAVSPPQQGGVIPAAAPAQAATPTAAPPLNQTTAPIFRATTRLVQVDVSVTHKNGRPVQGLQASEFSVLENGKPQEVKAFEAHTGVTKEQAAPPPPLPPNTYTNRTAVSGDDTINILLFDMLNTATADQAYARKQMIEFLRALPKGRRVALFVLTTRLDMVQGFTDSSDALVKVAEALLVTHSPILTTSAETQQERGEIDFLGKLISESARGRGGTEDPGNDTKQRLEQPLADMQAARTDIRVGFTLQALDGISRAVSGYPGRKNLIWMSGSFPLRLRRDEDTKDPMRNVRNYDSAIRSTTSLLATSRIAVYPVDVRGVRTSGIDLTTGAAASGAYADTSTGYSKTLNSESGTRFDEENVLRDVAYQTGGEAFIGTNDLNRAVQRGIDDGSTYYTLAYTPAEGNREVDFRSIEVKLNQKNVNLAYRRGYYWAARQLPVQESRAHALALALQPGMPPSTMLLLNVKVLPADESHKNTRMEFQVDAGGIAFSEMPGHTWRALLDCMTVAFDDKGNDAGQAANTFQVTLSAAEYESAQRSGLTLQQEIALPPGSYRVKAGIMDPGSEKVGTVDVPLVISVDKATK